MRDLNELRRKAEAARDEWETVHPMAAQRIIVGIGTDISHRLHCAPDAVREYAASARPTAVLALLDRLERAEADAARLRSLLAEAGKALEPFAIVGDCFTAQSDDDDSPWVAAKDDTSIRIGGGEIFSALVGDFRAARTVATKIEEALK